MAPIRARGLVLARRAGGGVAPSLLPVANRAVLVHALETLQAAKLAEVGIAVSAETRESVAETLASSGEPGVDITYIECPEEVGLLGSLLAAREFLDGSVCVAHNGDGLVREDIAPLVREVGTGQVDILVLLHRAQGAPATVEDERLLRLLARGRAGLAVGGLKVFGPRFLTEATTGAANLADAVERLVRSGGRPRAVESEDAWVPVRDAEELLAANRLVLDDLERSALPEGLSDSRVEGRVEVHPSARLERTVVRGPSAIGARAVVRDAYIGPYTSIGEGVRVEGAEIEHSVVLADAVIEHLGGRLEASVVGRGARIYRDFELPRAFRLRIGDGNEIVLR